MGVAVAQKDGGHCSSVEGRIFRAYLRSTWVFPWWRRQRCWVPGKLKMLSYKMSLIPRRYREKHQTRFSRDCQAQTLWHRLCAGSIRRSWPQSQTAASRYGSSQRSGGVVRDWFGWLDGQFDLFSLPGRLSLPFILFVNLGRNPKTYDCCDSGEGSVASFCSAGCSGCWCWDGLKAGRWWEASIFHTLPDICDALTMSARDWFWRWDTRSTYRSSPQLCKPPASRNRPDISFTVEDLAYKTLGLDSITFIVSSE